MGLTTSPLFNLAERRLEWVDQRQQLLAENIANADTPSYQARDVVPFAKLLDRTGTITPLRSSVRDLSPVTTDDQPIQHSIPASGSADTNLGKLANTEGMQTLVINLYDTYLGMFRTALDIGTSSSG